MKDYIESPFIRTIKQIEREQQTKARLVGWIVGLAVLAVTGWVAAFVSLMSR